MSEIAIDTSAVPYCQCDVQEWEIVEKHDGDAALVTIMQCRACDRLAVRYAQHTKEYVEFLGPVDL